MLPDGLPWRRRPFPTGRSPTESGWFEYGPALVLRRQTAITGPVRGAIHQDMHISVAQSGELCDGRPYLGGPEGVRSTPCRTAPRYGAANSAPSCARCARV